jgi:transcriptional regulator with XRE-family HTH domain
MKQNTNRKLNNKIDFELCERFKTIRTDRGLTQPEFAEELGTNRVLVNAIENYRFNPGLELLRVIRAKYHYSYDYIIDGK